MTEKGDKKMIDCYFEELEQIVMSKLHETKHSLHIAVAWISFDRYFEMFSYLLNLNVRIKIIVHDNK